MSGSSTSASSESDDDKDDDDDKDETPTTTSRPFGGIDPDDIDWRPPNVVNRQPRE